MRRQCIPRWRRRCRRRELQPQLRRQPRQDLPRRRNARLAPRVAPVRASAQLARKRAPARASLKDRALKPRKSFRAKLSQANLHASCVPHNTARVNSVIVTGAGLPFRLALRRLVVAPSGCGWEGRRRCERPGWRDRVDGSFAGPRLACRGPGGTRGARERPWIRLRGCRVRPAGRTRRTAFGGYCSGGGAARLRMDSPLSSMRYALCTTRSRMASARVPSPIVRYQSSIGSWLAMATDFLW